MNVRAWTVIGVHCVLLSACGGGGASSPSPSPPSPPPTPQPQSISFAAAPPTVLLNSTSAKPAGGGSGTGAITYTTSDPNVAVVDAAGVVNAVGVGTATITAVKAADANFTSAQASYTVHVQTERTVGAWIGDNDSRVVMPTIANGKHLARARVGDCASGDTLLTCANREQILVDGATITDSRATLAAVADYAILDGSNLGPTILVSAQRFSERIGHAAVFFKNRYWVIGGGVPVLPSVGPAEHLAKADVWSSADGRTWRLETADGGFGARWFHQSVVFNDRIWILSGAPAPIVNAAAPWYDDVWSSADGVSWRQESSHAFPWRSTDLNVVVFNNEMLAVSGGRVYSSTTGAFVPKVIGDPVVVTGSFQGRTHATLTVYNNELWYIGGKLDYPITQPPGGDAMNDVWKSADAITWTRLVEHAPFSPRYRHAAYEAAGKLWVLGGQAATNGVSGATSKDVWSTTDGINWTKEVAGGIERAYFMKTVQQANKVILIGGVQYAYSNSVWESTNGSTWSELSAHAQFSPRHTRAAAFKGRLWIVGGSAIDGRMADADTNEIWRSDDGLNWSRMTPTGSVFSPRDGHALVVFNDRLWVLGGWSNPSGVTDMNERLNDVWSSADGVTWRLETTAAAFAARVGHAAVAFGGKLWVIGGSIASGATNDVWSSSDGVAWSQATASASFAPRYSHRAVTFNDAMWVIAGGTATTYDDIWRSTDGTTWTQVTPLGTHFSARTRHDVAVANGRMYVVAGANNPEYFLGIAHNDVWSSADGFNWRREIEHAAFSPRALHALIVHRNELWMIGGLGIGLRNEVWRSADGASWRVGLSREMIAP
jgi:hypothetical protein